MANAICPTCGVDVPDNAPTCSQCKWNFTDSLKGNSKTSQKSLHEAMRQSVIQRASSCTNGMLTVRPAETVYGGLAIVLTGDISWSMAEDGKIEASSTSEMDLVHHLDTPEIRDKVWIAGVLFRTDARIAVVPTKNSVSVAL